MVLAFSKTPGSISAKGSSEPVGAALCGLCMFSDPSVGRGSPFVVPGPDEEFGDNTKGMEVLISHLGHNLTRSV